MMIVNAVIILMTSLSSYVSKSLRAFYVIIHPQYFTA